MRYIGGKSKIAKQIAETILSIRPEREHYLEPFIGGGSVFAEMAPHFAKPVAGDIHPDLCLMWDAAFNHAWKPPAKLSQDEWEALKTADPSALRAFAGFGCSFGTKWFRGYARSNGAGGAPRDHSAEASRSLLKVIAKIKQPIEVVCQSYNLWQPKLGAVIYCDPPYAKHLTDWESTSDLAYGFDGFDYSAFWKKCEEWHADGCHVFVSEYQAPSNWHEVGSWEKRVTLKRVSESGQQRLAVERLFHLA